MSNPKVRVSETDKYGTGVFASAPIKKDEVIAAFDGPYYHYEFDGWTDEIANHAIQCGEELWRDSTSIARLVNHSCDPNCGIKGLFEIVAMRDIAEGEEITWDYEMSEKNTLWFMDCRCGSPLCRKVIGNFENMPLETRTRYAGYISEWLKPSSKVSFISFICLYTTSLMCAL